MRVQNSTRHFLVWTIFAWVGAATIAGASPRPEIHVLQQSYDQTVIVLRWDKDAVVPIEEGFTLALPSGRMPELHIDRLQTEPAASGEGLSRIATNADLVQLGRPARVRGVWRIVLRVKTRTLDARGMPQRLVELGLRISHPSGPGEAEPAPHQSLEDPAHGLATAGLLNPEAARAFRRAYVSRLEVRTKRAGQEEDTFSRSPRWIRLELSETGLYRVRFEDLEALLPSQAQQIDPASLRLFASRSLLQSIDPHVSGQSWEPDYALRERPLFVAASQPEVGMGPGDYFLFYNGGIDTWLDRHDPKAGAWDHIEHEYSDRIALWLSWENVGEDDTSFDTPPARMGQRGAAPAGGIPVASHRERVHLEEANAMRYGIVQDNWTQSSIPITVGASERVSWTADHVIADSTAWIFANPVTLLSSGTPRIELLLNGLSLGTFDWTFHQQLQKDPIRFGAAAPTPLAGFNEVAVTNRSSGPKLDLDLVDVGYRRGLFVRGGRLEWTLFPDEFTTAQAVVFTVEDDEGSSNGFESGTVVLDTTDPLVPVVLTQAAVESGQRVLRFESMVEGGMHFAVYQPRGVLRPESISLKTPRHLRSEVFEQGGWDYLVVGPAELLDGMSELVDYHRQHLEDAAGNSLVAPRVGAIALQDIWDNFGYGVKEPAALRNFLKFSYLHEVEGEPGRQTEYVLLVGDASRDYRSRLPSSSGEQERDRCPTFIQTHWPRSSAFYPLGGEQWVPFAVDDWLGAFDAPDSSDFIYNLAPYDFSELAIGRLPVANLSETRMLSRRLADYQSSPPGGEWRNDILLVCDDEVGLATGSTRESFHIRQGEVVAETKVPPVIDVTKLYLTEYPNPPGPRNKPAARAEMKRQWSAGKLMVHYIGHGSPKQMADEKVFLIEDVGTLTNEDRLPLMLALSCDVAIFDSPIEKSMAEQLVLHSGGGAIATIAATQVTFVTSNDDLTNAIYEWLFPTDDPADARPVGSVLRSARASLGGNALRDNNSRKYVLFGDPALRLATAKLGLSLSGALADTIATGALKGLAGARTDGLPFSGGYEAVMREARDHSGYTRVDNDTLSFHIDYVLDGASFFRGQGMALGESLRVQSPVPVSLRPGSDGRVELLYNADGGQREVLAGFSEPVPVVVRASEDDDGVGPRIQLAFSTASSVVVPGDTLVATLSDSSGINVLGTSPASRISLNFDASDFPLDVTTLFRLEDDRFDQGSLSYALPADLSAGKHSVTLSASDTRGNLSTASTTFTLQAAGALEIVSALAVPSPFSNDTRFVIDLTEAAQVEIQVFTLDGRMIRRLEGVQPRRGVLVVQWDGRDFRGDEIANGAYLYTVRATFLQSSSQPLSLTRTGRVVKMR